MASVDLSHLSKRYGPFAAVSDVSIRVAEGEFLALLGPSGCGKTTTLRMIAGFVDPTEGTILIGGRDVTHLPPRDRDVGMVFQDYCLFPNLTVAENIAFGLKQRRVKGPAISRRVGELLDLIRLPHLARRYPSELSGGQQQRVALARAIAYEPRVLLMDEPLGALDLKLREAMQAELLAIQQSLGITTIMVTHDQSEAMSLADRVVVMADGHIRQIGTPLELYNQPVSTFVAHFIGKVNLFVGRVSAISGDQCALELAGGQRIRGPLARDITIGDEVIAAIRPEVMSVRLPADADDGRGETNSLPCQVLRQRFLGNVTRHFVRTPGDQTVVVEETWHRTYDDPGARISWPVAATHVFAATSADKALIAAEKAGFPDAESA